MNKRVNNFPSQLWEEYLNTLEVLKASMQNARTKHTNIKKQEAEQNSKEYTNSQIKVINDSISLYVKKNDLNSLVQQMPDSIKVAFNNISSEWIFDANKFTNKVDGKIGLTLGSGRLNVSRFEDGKPIGYYGQTFSEIPNSTQKYWGNTISGTYRSYYTDIGYNPNVKEYGDSTATGFDPFMKFVFYPYGTAYPTQGIYVFKDMILQQKLEVMNALKLHWHVDLGSNNSVRIGDKTNSLYKVFSNSYSSSKQEIDITPGVNSYGGIIINGAGYMNPTNTGGAYALGTTQKPFYKLYAVNATSVTSDKRLKTDIIYLDENVKPVSLGNRANISTELTTEDFRDFIKNTLRLASYRYNIALEKGDTETNIGFIAQDILYDKVGSNIVQLADKKDLNSELSYNQGNYISVIAGALQEEIKFRDNQIETLEKENKNLKSRLDNIEKILSIIESRCING
ncbi:MAG: tail fiber domain-containing protein [Peptostreptococcaceae bacterium]|nr:tail fiber domain-containing protein [Peptostreptococcaceae bacterium]